MHVNNVLYIHIHVHVNTCVHICMYMYELPLIAYMYNFIIMHHLLSPLPLYMHLHSTCIHLNTNILSFMYSRSRHKQWWLLGQSVHPCSQNNASVT